MVRKKCRWFLVQIDIIGSKPTSAGAGQTRLSVSHRKPTDAISDPSTRSPVTSLALFKAIRDTVTGSFVHARSSAATQELLQDIRVKHMDDIERLAMIRAPRERYKLVRRAITRTSVVKVQTQPSDDDRIGRKTVDLPVVLSVIRTNGCPRTARRAAQNEISQRYHRWKKELSKEDGEKAEKDFELRMEAISDIF